MIPGKFVWYDLMTPDVKKSQAFYRDLLGWKYVLWGETGYEMFEAAAGGPQGGFEKIDPAAGIPAHWTAYVSVADVDATAKRAEALGGKIVKPPTDIPNVGRYCILADRQGATIAPFKSANEGGPPPEGMEPVGTFCWRELLTTDAEDADAFYSELFGYKAAKMEMGEGMIYHVFSIGEKMEAGAMKMPGDAAAPPAWLYYVRVEDVDATAAKIGKLGGKLFVKPQDIPGMGRFAVAADPIGAMFAVFMPVARG